MLGEKAEIVHRVTESRALHFYASVLRECGVSVSPLGVGGGKGGAGGGGGREGEEDNCRRSERVHILLSATGVPRVRKFR